MNQQAYAIPLINKQNRFALNVPGGLGLSKSKVEVSKLLPKTNQNQKEETSKLKQFPTNMEVILPKGNKKVIKEKDSIEKPEA
jgi:hypothetical protein